MDGIAEVVHGRWRQNAMNADVKQFAPRMVDDHRKAGNELKSLASQKNVTLSAELDAKHKAMHRVVDISLPLPRVPAQFAFSPLADDAVPRR